MYTLTFNIFRHFICRSIWSEDTYQKGKFTVLKFNQKIIWKDWTQHCKGIIVTTISQFAIFPPILECSVLHTLMKWGFHSEVKTSSTCLYFCYTLKLFGTVSFRSLSSWSANIFSKLCRNLTGSTGCIQMTKCDGFPSQNWVVLRSKKIFNF